MLKEAELTIDFFGTFLLLVAFQLGGSVPPSRDANAVHHMSVKAFPQK